MSTDRLTEIEERLAESPDCSWPQPWDMEAEVKGDGHWDNEFHVNTEGGEGSHLATFQYRCHAEMFAALPSDLRDLLAVAKAARAAEESLSRLIDYPHNCAIYPKGRDGDGVCATCYGMMVGDVLRAALDGLEGGAS